MNINYSSFTIFAEWFLANISTTRCRSLMAISPLDIESKLWHLIFLHLMTFLVTFTFDIALFLELLACLSPLAYILATIIMERCFPIMQMTWTFPIGCNGAVPDEYFPDVIQKNRFYPNLTISIWLHGAKLHNSVLSSFRVICRKRFRKISERTVNLFLLL